MYKTPHYTDCRNKTGERVCNQVFFGSRSSSAEPALCSGPQMNALGSATPWWCLTFLWSMALLAALSPGMAGQAPAANLRHFIGCAVREFTFLAKKPGCGGLHITTDACWGRCETWEKPVLDPPFIESHQRVCTYNQTRLVTVKLPNCSAKVDPFYAYPVALRCDCSVCVTRTTECITAI
uniref:Glycoprotein hormone beta-5 n=2 Tax=Paramormyrops kingsleyae TaxID=1676925 RepID=A0A3B3R1I2_9TELE|nr:glycoprotein hormone beta-5 [Paramormyrops kingsleyae]